MPIRMLAALGLVAATPAAAQDTYMPYDTAVSDYGMIQLQSNLAKRRLQQAQQRQAGGPALSAKSRAICANKAKIARRQSPAQATRLHALCAQAGL